MKLLNILATYTILINLIAFFLMFYDKYKAKMGGFRIAESKLIFIAILGGSLGMIFAMKYFRHKTMHKKFSLGVPIIFIINLIIFAIAYTRFFSE